MVELFSLLIRVFPFIFVGALARELAEQTNDNSRGWRFFWGAAAALALNMIYGFIRSAIAEADEKWTAASFGLAMIIPAAS